MPCNTVTSINVDTSKFDVKRLIKALTQDGAVVTPRQFGWLQIENHKPLGGGYIELQPKTGEMKYCYLRRAEVNTILAQSYGRQVVRDQAKRFGWRISNRGPNKFVIKKGM